MVKVIFSALLVFFLFSTCYSQIQYEEGYFINNEGVKINCKIKNDDWNYNPTKFKYKLNDSSAMLTGDILNIREFGISNTVSYKRYIVNIDRSSNDINLMSNNYNPEFVKEQLFLKVLVEGSATLYKYKDIDVTRFFFKVQGTFPEQLVFKNYLISDQSTGENNTYKTQLSDSLKGKNISANMDRVNYQESDLRKIFTSYNYTSNTIPVENNHTKPTREHFDLTIRPGINIVTLDAHNTVNNIGLKFNTNISFRLGIESQFYLPFNKNKWSIIFEPNFQHFKSTSNYTYYGSKDSASINYNSIGLPIGIRHSFFVGKKSKIFIDALFIYSLNLNSKIQLGEGDLTIKTRPNIAFDIGYIYNKRFSLEARWGSKHEILNNYLNWTSHFQTFSIMAGYTIF